MIHTNHRSANYTNKNKKQDSGQDNGHSFFKKLRIDRFKKIITINKNESAINAITNLKSKITCPIIQLVRVMNTADNIVKISFKYPISSVILFSLVILTEKAFYKVQDFIK